jgi:uncharacterized membrane protein
VSPEQLPSALVLALQALAVVYVFLLPGFLLVSCLNQDWSRPLRLLVGFALAGLFIPMASFVVAWALGTNIQPWVPVLVATLLNLGAGALLWRRRPRGPEGLT